MVQLKSVLRSCNIMNGVSLFSNVGVAEAYLQECGINIVAANEIIEERAKMYSYIYPNTKMFCGDITKDEIYNEILEYSKNKKIEFLIATPPCQGMSTAGKMKQNDERNYLIHYAIRMILDLKPKYVLLENVPKQMTTKIQINGSNILIPDYIKMMLGNDYNICNKNVNAVDYGVPQMRTRCIFLCTLKTEKKCWNFPNIKEKPITLYEAIGDLPSLDPKIQGFSKEKQLEIFPDYEKKRIEGLKVSKWHYPPTHKIRHVISMMHTPEGHSALENAKYFPSNFDGTKVKGYSNTYKRQWWNKPGYTVTTYNGAVCSQDNVHPGRFEKCIDGEKIYSDARVLSIYELLIVMSLPKNWNIPDWASDTLIRQVIGEGIPPLLIKKAVESLIATGHYDR